jgi:hypothetical protein
MLVQDYKRILTGLRTQFTITNRVSVVCYIIHFIFFLCYDITDALTRVTQVGGGGNRNNIVFNDV